jgi:nucleotide-binding universal stress UspA family protein
LKPNSARVLDWANHLAEEYQADLTLMHVAGDESRRAREEAVKALEALRDSTASRATIRVESGDVAKVVTRIGQEWKADLLVIGRKAESGVLGRLEVVAYSLIRQSPCPVVSV